MEHLTEALDRLGVKTCPVCGKTGAKSLCVACRSVSYCGKACQKVAWPTHKRECRRIVREKKEAEARLRDPIEAAYAADEAICRVELYRNPQNILCEGVFLDARRASTRVQDQFHTGNGGRRVPG